MNEVIVFLAGVATGISATSLFILWRARHAAGIGGGEREHG